MCDGTRGHYGHSGSVELPEALAHEVLDKGVELSLTIDRFASAVSIRDAQGAWGSDCIQTCRGASILVRARATAYKEENFTDEISP